MTDTMQVLSASSIKALDEFNALSDTEYLDAWKELPAPAFAELDGEFSGAFPPNYNEIHKKWQGATLFDDQNPRGYWLGKAFTPLGPVTGEGYNVWRMADGSVERRIRYGTHLGLSRVDGNPAVVMTYSSFNRNTGAQSDVVDEIRKLADGVFIGLGTARASTLLQPDRAEMLKVHQSYGFELRDDYRFNEYTPPTVALFVLSGPVHEYVGVDDPHIEDQ